MFRLAFLFLALGLLTLNSAGPGLPHPGGTSSNPDSGWEIDPNG